MKAQVAMERILLAATELQDYVGSGASNPDQQKQLADALEVAIDEFINLPSVPPP